ncbi:NAD-dependent epimerase/dehydratase family protein [Hymenobacter sp. BT664]|uniref:NAD-dependent epimerase/dehydratase family protein n=1 Tax=Hymenobacter montanus TaxID=2771359 RepID=A0A927GHQ5_9BACT|nr:NAD-dependent epimerase/dehydratase family protein [Hymenobacter montanus]MBD2766658.1 NAD-dependent epimerase/dehydratase family protein [Hymenobacter montanus]
MKIKAIITGATGMLGEGVLLECLRDADVESVLLLSRQPSGYAHPKLRELLHADFQHLQAVESQLAGYNACFYCAGVSAVGRSPAEYERITFDTTLAVAQTLLRLNPDLAFIYVTGAGTDSSEQGRSHWARTKGRTENALLRLPFRQAYMFRPGFVRATPGQRNVLKLYKYVSWLYPLFRRLGSNYVSTMAELGQAMLNAVRGGYPKRVLEVPDIVTLARAQTAAHSTPS